MKSLPTLLLIIAGLWPTATFAGGLDLAPPEDLSAAAPPVLVNSTQAVERMARQEPVLSLNQATPATWLESLQPPAKPGGLSLLGRVVDYTEADEATFRSEVLRLMIPTRRLQPFAAVAREKDAYLEETIRMGFGAGTRWVINRRMNFGTEVLVFPAERNAELESSLNRLGDVRLLTRLQISF